MEEKEEGITLGEIFHVIFIKKWLLLAVTVIVWLLGFIFLQVIYNPSKEIYQCEFEIKFPGYSSGKYPDGTEIIYKNFINLEYLQKTKDSKEEYKNLDVVRMSLENDIHITEVFMRLNNQEYKTGRYLITAKSKYFSSGNQARLFLQDLTRQPVDYAIQKGLKIDYKYHLVQSVGSGDYKTQIDHLIAQRDQLLEAYDNIIENYSNTYIVNGQLVSQAQAEIKNYFSTYNLESMQLEVELQGYTKKNSDYLNSIEREIENLKREKELNTNKLVALDTKLDEIIKKFNTGGSTAQLDSLKTMIDEITTLTTRNAEIDHLIDVVYKQYLDSSHGADYEVKLKQFDTDLQKHYEKLEQFTDTYIEFANVVYNLNSKVVFTYNSVIVEDGGINILVGLLVFLVIGFILACCVNLVLDMPKYLKSKKEGTLEIVSEVEPAEAVVEEAKPTEEKENNEE